MSSSQHEQEAQRLREIFASKPLWSNGHYYSAPMFYVNHRASVMQGSCACLLCEHTFHSNGGWKTGLIREGDPYTSVKVVFKFEDPDPLIAYVLRDPSGRRNEDAVSPDMDEEIGQMSAVQYFAVCGKHDLAMVE